MSSGILPNLDIFSCEFILKCAQNEIILHLQRFTTILKHSFTRFWRYDWPPRLVAACRPPESEPNTRREDCWRPGNRTTLAAAASGLGCNTQRHPSTLSWAIIMLPCDYAIQSYWISEFSLDNYVWWSCIECSYRVSNNNGSTLFSAIFQPKLMQNAKVRRNLKYPGKLPHRLRK